MPLPGTANISGRVVDEKTGRPLAGALVTVLDPAQPIQDMRHPDPIIATPDVGPLRRHQVKVLAGANGTFHMENVASGEYTVTASFPGYAQQTYRPPRSQSLSDSVIRVNEGAQLSGIDFQLAVGAQISGRATDHRGIGVEGARVRVRSLSGLQGTAAKTDARGYYRLEDLPQGRWYVGVEPPFVIPGTRTIVAYYTNRLVYHPGAEAPEDVHEPPVDAWIVTTVSGGHVRDIDIRMSPRPLYTISGHVRSDRRGQIQGSLTSSPAGSIQSITVTEDGTFVVDRIKPGHYVLWFRQETESGYEVASEALDVSDNRNDIDLYLAPAATITGRVVTRDGSPLPTDSIRVAALLMDGQEDIDPLARDQVGIESDGSFTLHGIFGERAFRLIGLPSGWKLERVLDGDRPVSALLVSHGDSYTDIRLVIAQAR